MNVRVYEPRVDARPCQGAVYQDVFTVLLETGPGLDVDFEEWRLPYAVAMSQECDLVQDYDVRSRLAGSDERVAVVKHDKLLPTILLCPAYLSEELHAGEHLKSVGRVMESHGSSQWKLIRQNNNSRYHYLACWQHPPVPELVVDFKHFFVMPPKVMISCYGDQTHYIARLSCPYREDLSHRFAAYLARIGLPMSHHQFPSNPTAGSDGAISAAGDGSLAADGTG